MSGTTSGSCGSRTIAPTDNVTPGTPLPGHRVSQIALGDGRPFFFGLTQDYEDWYLRYIGTYWTKTQAIQLLAYNRAWFPRTTNLVDPRVFNINWYRLFPDEVGNMIEAVMTDESYRIGPVVAPDGTYEMRNALDPNTGLPPDYSEHHQVLPTIAYVHQFQLALFSMALMSSPWDDQVDALKTFKMAVEGAADDFGSFEALEQEVRAGFADPNGAEADAAVANQVAEFTHPVTGQRIRGLKVGDHPIGFKLVERLNFLKERFEILDSCVADVDGVGQTDPYCACTNTIFERELPNGTVERRCTVDMGTEAL